MSSSVSYDEVSGWIERQRSELLSGKYVLNVRDAGLALDDLKKKLAEVDSYEDKVKDVSAQTDDAERKNSLQQAFKSLKALCEKKLHCLETTAQISSLEDNVSSLSQVLDLRATLLIHPGTETEENHPRSEDNLSGFIARTSQDCIFGVRDNWNWIITLIKCVDVHLRNGAAYHEFFHEVEESEPWMLGDIALILKYFETKSVSGEEDEAKKLAGELERIYLTLRQWEAKTTRLWENATRLVPVPLRTSPNKEPLPARAICDYTSKEVGVRENEDIVLLDSSKPKIWRIKNGRGEEGDVPAPVVLIPGPDAEAIKTALRLRLQLLANWTNALKLIGKRLIYFMLIIFKSEYTGDEMLALRSMDELEKENLLRVLTYIEDAFKRYWSDHEGFISVQERMLVLRVILENQSEADVPNEEMYRQLVILINTLHQATAFYQSTSDEWEKFKAVLEASRSPELMLILDKWEQLQFVSKDYFSKFWKSSLALDAKDKSMDDLKKKFTLNGVEFEDLVDIGGSGGIVERGHDEATRPDATISADEVADEEAVTKQESQKLEYESRSVEFSSTGEGFEEFDVTGAASASVGEEDESEFGVAKERKTAETEQLSSAEMEEKKTFHIKSVVNPADQQEISLQQAIMIGVIKPDEGVYVNTTTGEAIPIAVAMGNGLIKVMFSKTKRSEEKTSSIGIITVKTIREGTQPYIILSVKDTKTDEELNPDEATKRGILKEAQGAYIDLKTGKKLLITEAAEAKLINLEYCGEKPEPEVVSTTYAVRAVVDRKQKKTVTFNEAIRKGIIERDTGAYVDTLTGEKIYVGDAIMRGFLKARIVEDPSSLNIDPENSILIDKTQTIREKLLKPLKIISAFKMAAKK